MTFLYLYERAFGKFANMAPWVNLDIITRMGDALQNTTPLLEDFSWIQVQVIEQMSCM